MQNTYLLTGSSGFLGGIIMDTLSNEKIIDIGRRKGSIMVDLSKTVPILPICDIVIHAAGKAHTIPKTKLEREDFYNINVLGTSNLLKSLEKNRLPKSFVFISSVAVYGKQSGTQINENAPLLACDPYGQSKILAEKLIWDWCIKHKVVCAILRLPLIIGKNPPGNLHSMINGIRKGYYFNIAHGKAKKSMVNARDVAKIIPIAAKTGGIYNLTDGYHPSFSELSILFSNQLKIRSSPNLPYLLAKVIAFIGDIIGNKFPLNSISLKKITSDLTFDDSKAVNVLGWQPSLVLDDFKIV